MLSHGLGMKTLKELDLSRCSKISDAGINHIVTIESLEKLYLSETGLTDKGVMAISSLTNLRLLDLGGIHFTDKALLSLQVLTRLEHLDIWGSETTDEGASVLKAFTRLRFLNLSWTHVTRLVLPVTMRSLNMSNCTIHSICDEDSEFPIPLETLIVSASSIGNIAEILSSIQASSLLYLDLCGCSLSNLSFLENMINLVHLDLSSSGITDDEIEHVARIGRNLKYLSLKDTWITSQALCVLAGTVPNLISLSLGHSKVDDSALPYISLMPLLRTLDLSCTCIEGFIHTDDTVDKKLSMSELENLRYLESLNLEGTQLLAEVIPPLASITALKFLYLRSDFMLDPGLHALSSASNLEHLGFCGSILSNSGLLQFVPPAKLCVLDLRDCWLLTGDAISLFCRRHPWIEVKHELMEELKANHVGTSQCRKPRKAQPVKARVANSLAGSSRLPDSGIVDERIKYTKEELLELQHLVESSVMHAVQIPPGLRRTT